MIFANFMGDILQRSHFTFSLNSHKFIQVDKNITVSKFFYSGQKIVLIKIHLSNFFVFGWTVYSGLVGGRLKACGCN